MDLKSKYLSLPIQVKAVLWIAVCKFLQQGVNMLVTPLVTRLLPTEEYGIVTTFNSWKTILLFLLVFAVFQSIMNLCVRYVDHDLVATATMSLAIVIATGWLLIFFVFDDALCIAMDMSKSMALCLLLQTSFQAIILCWTNRMQYDYRYKDVITVTLFTSIIAPLIGLLSVVFYSKTALAMLFPQMVVWGGTTVVVFVCSCRKSRTIVHIDIWKYALGFSIPLLPHYFSETILQGSDRIMISQMLGDEAVAIYGVAYTIGSIVMAISSVINSTFASYQYHMIQEKNYKDLAKNTNIILFVLACFLCLVMLFAKEIVLFFGGMKYIDSVSSVIPIALGVYYNYVFQLFARVQEYFEQKHTIVIASLSCAILNVILNYIFIPKYGYIAASYTTFVCYLIFCILHYFFYRMACEKNIECEIYDAKGITAICCLVMVVGFGIVLIGDYWYIKYGVLLVSLVVAFFKRNDIINFVKNIKGG